MEEKKNRLFFHETVKHLLMNLKRTHLCQSSVLLRSISISYSTNVSGRQDQTLIPITPRRIISFIFVACSFLFSTEFLSVQGMYRRRLVENYG